MPAVTQAPQPEMVLPAHWERGVTGSAGQAPSLLGPNHAVAAVGDPEEEEEEEFGGGSTAARRGGHVPNAGPEGLPEDAATPHSTRDWHHPHTPPPPCARHTPHGDEDAEEGCRTVHDVPNDLK